MRKVLSTVAVSTALIMGGAVAASAAGIEMEGSVRVRGLSEQRMITDQAEVNLYDEQVRLGMKSMPSDNLTGYILLETGATSTDTYTWGQETSSAGSTLYRGGTNGSNGLNLIQAWIDYKPVKTVGIKVGHQTVAPGTKQFVNHVTSGDDAIFVNYDPTASTHAHVAVIKLQENTTNDNSDDLDAYALVGSQKFGDAFKMGANLIHVKGGAEDEAAAAFPGLALTNLGVDAEFKIGNLTLMGDGNYQWGTIYETNAVGSEIEANGYALQAGVDYKIDNSNVGLLFAMGSGEDTDATTNAQRGDAFVNFLGDSPWHVYIPGYRKVTPGSYHHVLAGETDGANSGLSNLTLYQLNAKTAVTCPLTDKKLSVRAALSYMETTEDVISTTGAREDEIGTELDIVAAWALTSNLTYQIEAAYLWTGDVYKNVAAGTNAGTDPEDAYFLRHGISMKF